MHYIRFLKSPALSTQGNATSVKALITIATDLGDSFFLEDVQLQVNCLVSNDWTDAVVNGPKLQWKAGMRSLPLEIKSLDLEDEFEVSVVVAGSDHTDVIAVELHDDEGDISLPVVLPAISKAIDSSSSSVTPQKLVRRDFRLHQNHLLSIWEESGESIARHIWDAGVALVACMDVASQGSPSGLLLLDSILTQPRDSSLNVVELGCGCGLVGLGLATMLPRVNVVLTDLEDAREITELNISESQLNTDSEAKFLALNWEEPLQATFQNQPIDLVLVADCTYNPESSPALVRSILSLVSGSPQPTLVLVAMKLRHPSERIFFQLMDEAGLVIREQIEIQAPCSFRDGDEIEPQTINIYAYSLQSGTG